MGCADRGIAEDAFLFFCSMFEILFEFLLSNGCIYVRGMISEYFKKYACMYASEAWDVQIEGSLKMLFCFFVQCLRFCSFETQNYFII